MLNGVFIRKALKTSSQEQAQRILRGWEASGAAEQTAEQIRIDNATASFMRDIEARNWQEPTRR
jgi:hypothetical protein